MTVVRALTDARLPDAMVEVSGDGRHLEVVVVSKAFEGKSTTQPHRMAKDTVKAQVESEELHALSIRSCLS